MLFCRFCLSEFAEWIKSAESMTTTLAPQLTNSRQPRQSKRTIPCDLLALTFGTIHLVRLGIGSDGKTVESTIELRFAHEGIPESDTYSGLCVSGPSWIVFAVGVLVCYSVRFVVFRGSCFRSEWMQSYD